MKRKWILVSVFTVALAAVISGCGNDDKNDNDSKDGKVQLRFATWDVAEDMDHQQKLVDEFNKAHENIEVTLEAYGSNYDTKISAGMGSSDAPDIMYMWNYPAYADGLEPLESYIEKEGGAEFKEKFSDTLWNYNSLEEEIYGVPVGFTSHVLYYNKDLFTEAGLEEPTNEWIWPDLQDAAKTITEKTDAKGFAFQMKPDPYDFEIGSAGRSGATIE